MTGDPLPPDGQPQGPTQWCGKCEAMVVPRGKGQCPRCGRILRESFLARRHPVNVLRRQQILDALVEEYSPSTLVQRQWCEDLASVREQLEGLRPSGSTEWQRLMAAQQSLGASLEATRVVAPTPTPADVVLSDEELAARLEAQAAKLAEYARLVRRAKQFEDMPCHPDGTNGGPAPDDDYFVVPDDDEADAEGPSAAPEADRDAVPTAVSEPVALPEPCRWCHQSPARCDEIRATRPDAWDALHYDHPDVVKRREEAAMNEMLEALRRARLRY